LALIKLPKLAKTRFTKSYHKWLLNIPALTGTPSSPVLSYESAVNEILITWLPFGSDTVCGPVTYNVTVMPSHGTIVRMNDTFYNITGLNNDADYTVTVYASNSFSNGKPAVVTVRTKPGVYVCT